MEKFLPQLLAAQNYYATQDTIKLLERKINTDILRQLESIRDKATDEDTWYIWCAIRLFRTLGYRHQEFIIFNDLIQCVRQGRPAWTVAPREFVISAARKAWLEAIVEADY